MLFRIVDDPNAAEKFDVFRKDAAEELQTGLPDTLDSRVEPLSTSYGQKWVIKCWPKGTHHLHTDRGWIKKVVRRPKKPIKTEEW